MDEWLRFDISVQYRAYAEFMEGILYPASAEIPSFRFGENLVLSGLSSAHTRFSSIRSM
jgi:hypothetical protein